MFNNTFQAILLLVTFTIRRKKIFHEITLETAAQTSVSPFHRWCAQDVLNSAPAEEPSVGLSVQPGLSPSGALELCLCHHLRWHRKAGGCHWEPEGPWLPTVHWAPLPRCAPVPLPLEKPCSSSCREGKGETTCSAAPAELPMFLRTQSTPAGFVPTFQSSSVKVFQRRFLTLQLKVQ